MEWNVERLLGVITESGHLLSFCKKMDFFGGDSKTKLACFFVGIKERKEIYVYIYFFN